MEKSILFRKDLDTVTEGISIHKKTHRLVLECKSGKCFEGYGDYTSDASNIGNNFVFVEVEIIDGKKSKGRHR